MVVSEPEEVIEITEVSPRNILQLDMYVILCNIYLSYFILVSSSFQRLSEKFENHETRTFMYEIKTFNNLYVALKSYLMNRVAQDLYGVPVRANDYKSDFPRVECYEWLGDYEFPLSGFLSIIDQDVEWFGVDLSEIDVDHPVPYPETPAQIFVDTLNAINRYMISFVKEKCVCRETGSKIQKWLSWSKELSSMMPFSKESFYVEKGVSTLFSQLETRQDNQYIYFSPGALFVALSVRVMDRINEYTNSIAANALNQWRKNVDTFERALGSYVSRTVISSERHYLLITDPSTLLPFPFIHNISMNLALSDTLPPDRRAGHINPGYMHQHAFIRFVDAVRNYYALHGTRHTQYDTLHHNALVALEDILPFDQLDTRRNGFKKYASCTSNKKRNAQGEEKKLPGVQWNNLFDNMVFLLGPNVSKLFPCQKCPRSFGGTVTHLHKSAN